jgi:methionyl-tRNA formyltransferase
VLEHALHRFEIEAVVFPPDAVYRAFLGESPGPIRRFARAAKRVVKGPQFPGAEHGERLGWDEICARWPPASVDLFLSGGYPAIFPLRVLEIAKSSVNIHTSLLPQLKGRHPHYWAVTWGLSQSGLTAHELTEDVDEGPIVGQVVTPLTPETTYGEHYADLQAAVPEALDQVVRWLKTGERVKPVPVAESMSPGEPEVAPTPGFTAGHLRAPFARPGARARGG